MANFVQTTSPTPFSIFDSDTIFQTESDNMVVFTKRSLGDDIISVELTKKQIWSCLERATLEYSAQINLHQAKNQLVDLLGQMTGSLTGSEARYPRETLAFMERQAEAYGMLAGVGGSYDTVLGHIELRQSVQDYNIYTELKNSSGSIIFDSQAAGTKTKLKILEVFHFSPDAAYRFFDSTSAINYLNNEFSFESFTPETIFYVLPIFEDILRAQQMNTSTRVRRSNYSYDLIGREIRIFPMPVVDSPKNLYIRVMLQPDPFNPSFQDDSISGISNISNIPYGNLVYSKINSAGRQWIREYCLALCKELLGLIRSKFKSIPIPNADLTLNGEDLIAQGREDKEKLITGLKEMLDSVTYEALIEREANKSENLLKNLRAIPFKKPVMVF